MPVPDRGGKSRGLALGRPQPGEAGHPGEFTTKSRVVIISNDWKTLNRNVAALQDRGHVLLFQPGAAEVHRKAGTGSTTGRSMSGLPPTCTGCVSRRCGITCGPGSSRPPEWTGPRCWRPRREQAGPARRRAAGQRRLRQHRGRVKAFVEQGGGCRATFFNYRRKLAGGSQSGGEPGP